MKLQYRLFRRGWGVYYCMDNLTGQQESLHTRSKPDALRLLHARNEASRQPLLNLQLARVYLTATDEAAAGRTWQDVMAEIVQNKSGPTRERWETAIKDHAFDAIRRVPVVQTRAEQFLKVLRAGRVATNVFLRRLHNFALDMNWILAPVLPKRQWPAPVYKEKRAITQAEHERIVNREANPERRAFYELCWHLGGSQTDIARLQAEDIDWENHIIAFQRIKLKRRQQQPALICFGDTIARLLTALPRSGPLFPYLAGVRASDRATEFKQRCRGLGISGVTLHSYRYAWAERARSCGYPERFAQQALGHGSKAVHRAYSRKAEVRVPALEDYERDRAAKVIPFSLENRGAVGFAGLPGAADAVS